MAAHPACAISEWRGYRPACAAGAAAAGRRASPAPRLPSPASPGLARADLAGPRPGDVHLAGGHKENDEMLKGI